MSSSRQSIYRYGDRVLMGPDSCKIEGTVLGVEMRGCGYQQVTYLVSWWDDKVCKNEWLHAAVVEPADDGSQRAAVIYDAGGSDA